MSAGTDTVELARRIRIHALRMTSRAGASHIGSAFSIADLLAVLYGGALRVDPARPDWAERDRLILSKGHGGAVLYAVLAEVGFFGVDRLEDYYGDGSTMCGHVTHVDNPGVDFSTGSLGHGLSVGAGMALAGQLDEAGHRVVVLLSDGECDEGSTWEAVLLAAHHGLSNLVAVVDYNQIQSLAPVRETLELEPFAGKWEQFGWTVREVDGHDHAAFREGFEAPTEDGRPTVILAHTVKGKGVSFMENTVLWHYRCARGEEFEAALAELESA